MIGQSFTSDDDAVINKEIHKGIFELKYKKENKSNFATSKFTMRVSINENTKKLDKIVFFRFNVFGNDDISFEFNSINMLTDPILLHAWRSSANSIYDFSDPANTVTLRECEQLINSKITDLSKTVTV